MAQCSCDLDDVCAWIMDYNALHFVLNLLLRRPHHFTSPVCLLHLQCCRWFSLGSSGTHELPLHCLVGFVAYRASALFVATTFLGQACKRCPPPQSLSSHTHTIAIQLGPYQQIYHDWVASWHLSVGFGFRSNMLNTKIYVCAGVYAFSCLRFIVQGMSTGFLVAVMPQ